MEFSMTDHWRIYEPIPGVQVFTADGSTIRDSLQVVANVAPDPAPIRIGAIDDPAFALTVAQSRDLRARLERAEHDVEAGSSDAEGEEDDGG
jgi:hypothetical protein